MKQSLKSFAVVFGCCALFSLALVLFNGRSLASLIDLGSYVGAGTMLFGCWRLTNTPSDVVQHLHMQQRIENFHAEIAGQPAPQKGMIQMYLSSGPLAFGGLVWLVMLQAVRYGFNISLS